MLQEYKKIYFEKASNIQGWETLSKNELCNKYIEHEQDKELTENYFSAIVYKYWYLINKFHQASRNICAVEDCYDWLIDSITYTLKHRRWLCPDSSVYQDVNGPDKIINRCMKCRRYTYYQAINRQKRKDDFNLLSLDKLKTDHEDNLVLVDEDGFIPIDISDIITYIRNVFQAKDYFLAFVLDLIINYDVFSLGETGVMEFKKGKIVKYFDKINDTYLQYFSETYQLDFDKVNLAHKKYIKELTPTDIYQKLSFNTTKLKHDEDFKKVVTG